MTKTLHAQRKPVRRLPGSAKAVSTSKAFCPVCCPARAMDFHQIKKIFVARKSKRSVIFFAHSNNRGPLLRKQARPAPVLRQAAFFRSVPAAFASAILGVVHAFRRVPGFGSKAEETANKKSASEGKSSFPPVRQCCKPLLLNSDKSAGHGTAFMIRWLCLHASRATPSRIAHSYPRTAH